MAPSTTPRLLRFSIPSADASDLMLACLDYQDRCRRENRACPGTLLRLPAQMSAGVTRGQEGSALDAALAVRDAECMDSSLLTYQAAARLLSWSVSTIKRRVADGVLDPVRVGRTVRLRRTDLRQLIEKGAA